MRKKSKKDVLVPPAAGSFVVTVSREIGVVTISAEEAVRAVTQKHCGWRVESMVRSKGKFLDFLVEHQEVLGEVEEEPGYDVSLTEKEISVLLGFLAPVEPGSAVACPSLSQDEALNLLEKLEDASIALRAHSAR